ncbi:Tll0287-like domain-containing protein [Luteimonas sp. e5]
MTPRSLHLLPLAIALFAVACTAQPPSPPTAPTAAVDDAATMEAQQRAQAAAQAFSSRLQSALKARMSEGGPVAAIDFCKAEAPLIAADVAIEHDVGIGRVAVPGKLRNPANQARDWQAEVVRSFQAKAGAGQAPGELRSVRTRDLPAGVALRMMRGIEVQEGCLACHGKQRAPGVDEALARLYPDDMAIGFEPGDLRGALWVEVPAR